MKLVNAKRLALLIGVVCLNLPLASAQPFPHWGILKPGTFGVGFKVIHTYDYSRSYKAKADYQGRLAVGETARPIRVSRWYPAIRAKSARPVLYGEYVFQRETERGEKSLTPQQEAKTTKEFAAFIRPVWGWNEGKQVRLFPDDLPQERVDRMITTPTAAGRNAPPVKGSFPIILNLGSTEEQTVLFEYPAS